jgi:hypothetical protein
MASNAIGSALDMGLRAMLRRHGLEDRRDYTLVEKTQYDLRFIKRPLDIAPYVDLSRIKEAGARLR